MYKKIFSLFVIYLIIMIPGVIAWNINNLKVDDYGHNYGVFSFDTDVITNGTIHVGKTEAASEFTAYSYDNSTHKIMVDGLTPNTKYYFYATATDGISTMDDKTRTYLNLPYYFNTKSPPDLTPPNISDVGLSLPSEVSAIVTWKTDEAADTRVYWGTNLENVSIHNSFTSSHSMTLNELVKDQEYRYIIGACDQKGNCINSSEMSFIAGLGNEPPKLELDLPDRYGKRSITFDVITKPSSLVKLYLNNIWVSQKKSDSSGTVTFNDVSLSGFEPSVEVKVEVKDQVGNIVEDSHIIEVDFSVPKLKMGDLPERSNKTTINVNGSVEPTCTVEFLVSNKQDIEPPAQVNGLVNTSIGTNSVSLEWDPVDGAYEYAIYRNTIRIKVTRGTSFTDSGAFVGSGETYGYQIAAVDENCNVGKNSTLLSVNTTEGGFAQVINPPQANLSCDAYAYKDSIKVGGSFDNPVVLGQGTNYVTVRAINDFGNTVELTDSVIVDTEKPSIIKTNIARLTPSYERSVVLTGTASEPGKIYVYVNSTTPNFQTETLSPCNKDSTCNFSLRVDLSRDPIFEYNEDGGSGEVQASYTTKWRNPIKIVVEDKQGYKSDPTEGYIDYQLCGEGSWYKVYFHDQTPDMLSPRMILEGMSQIGISLDVTWAGGYYPSDIKSIDVRPRSLSLDEKKDWDEEWITVQKYFDRTNASDWKGYVQLKVKQIDPSTGDNWTTFMKEENISKHRMGSDLCPATGCLRYPLEVEITFVHNNETQIQKTCLDLVSTIEPRIPPDYIPEEFLKSAIDFFNGTIEAIDTILDPLKTISTYTMYSCLVMMGVDFILIFTEAYQCKFSSFFSSLSGGDFQEGIAQMGYCNDYYGQNSDSQVADACRSCEAAVEKRKKFETAMKMICDRVFCPAAPTFQTFVSNSEKIKNEIKHTSEKDIAEDLSKGLKYLDSDNVGYSCALPNVYNKVKTYMEEHVDQDETPAECDGLHVPQEACCKTEYEERWGSACLIMDEFKESACLYAQQTDDPSHVGDTQCNVLWNAAAGFCEANGGSSPKLVSTKYYINTDCVYGPDFRASDDPYLYFRITRPQDGINTYLVEPGYVTKEVQITTGTTIEKGEPSQINSQLMFVPADCGSSSSMDFSPYFDLSSDQNKDKGQETQYNYEAFGNELANIACKDSPQSTIKKPATDSDYEAECKREFARAKKPGVTEPDYDTKLKECVATKKAAGLKTITTTTSSPCTNPPTYGSISTGANTGASTYTSSDAKDIEGLHGQIVSALGIHKDKVVDPTSSFLRSVQCVCLPAMKSYLSLYRNMMMAIKNCFQTILLTGDGNAGMCRAVISVYVCDLIYDLIRCFMEKYSATGARGDTGASMGNFFGALTYTSNKISNNINSRYGDSSTFNAIFGERKLAHGICMWAFTGTWDLDIAGMMESDFSIPVASTGAIYPCERRFVSFNQAKDGLAKWNYHLGAGLVAGADLTYDLKLVCSDSMECNPQEGFANGRCDCYGKGEKSMSLENGQLKAGATYGGAEGEPFKNVEAPVRYDKAVLEWEYKNNEKQTVTDKVECKINQAGGSPPAICSFDVSVGEFRCGVNFGTGSWARFTATPEAKPDNGQYFTVGETMEFEVPVSQKIPQEDDCDTDICEYTKYVKVQVTHNNVEIAKSIDKKIEYSQDHIETLRTLTPLGRDMFDSNFGVRYNKCFVNNDPNICPTFTTVSGTPKPEYSQTYIYLYNKDNSYYIDIRPNPINKETDLNGRSTKVSLGVNQKIISDSESGLKFELSSGLQKNDKMTVLSFTYSKGTSDLCAEGADIKLKAIFTIMGTKNVGGSYNLDPSSIVSYKNEPQQKTIEFNARCTDATDTAESVPKCPIPMYETWDYADYLSNNGVSWIGTKSSCDCTNERCQRNTKSLYYCGADGYCHTNPEVRKGCVINPPLINVQEEWSTNFNRQECICGSNICKQYKSEYCYNDGTTVGCYQKCEPGSNTYKCICGTSLCDTNQKCTNGACV